MFDALLKLIVEFLKLKFEPLIVNVDDIYPAVFCVVGCCNLPFNNEQLNDAVDGL